MTYNVLGGTLNLTQLNCALLFWIAFVSWHTCSYWIMLLY